MSGLFHFSDVIYIYIVKAPTWFDDLVFSGLVFPSYNILISGINDFNPFTDINVIISIIRAFYVLPTFKFCFRTRIPYRIEIDLEWL